MVPPRSFLGVPGESQRVRLRDQWILREGEAAKRPTVQPISRYNRAIFLSAKDPFSHLVESASNKIKSRKAKKDFTRRFPFVRQRPLLTKLLTQPPPIRVYSVYDFQPSAD